MTQNSYIRDAVARWNPGDASAIQTGAATGRQCAYNATRQRFLSADVDAADFSGASLDARLPALSSDTGAGLWLLPFRGISPTSVRVPVDLLYLDANCAVLDTVESFPIARVSASSRPCASVLVLPAGAIRSTETLPGDRLLLCPPEEMKRRLQQLTEAGPELAAAQEAAARAGSGRLLQWEGRLKPKSPAENALVEARPEELQPTQSAALVPAPLAPAVQEPAQPAAKSAKPGKSWLQRLLSPDPPEPRQAPRESLPGLSAYFFTGGTPVAHNIRDISLTGLYVFTTERWYIGTMIRITLTDRGEPTAERSITLNANVVRWGNDGVGLKFVLQNGRERRQLQVDGMYNGADKSQIEQFLQRLRG